MFMRDRDRNSAFMHGEDFERRRRFSNIFRISMSYVLPGQLLKFESLFGRSGFAGWRFSGGRWVLGLR